MGGLLAAVALNLSVAGSLSISRLRVEFLENPLAVDETRPRFSWIAGSKVRGARPTAYRILVSSTEDELQQNRGTLWDSGKQRWLGENLIEYAGSELRSRQQAFWKVQLWDEKEIPCEWSKTASFKMGLLSGTDWTAKWITDSVPPPPQTPGHNGFHSALSKSPDAQKWVAIDLGSAQEIDAVTLFPASPYDWREKVAGFLFPIRFRIEASSGDDFTSPILLADKSKEDFVNPKSEPTRFEFPRVTARYVRLVVTKQALRDPGNYGFTLAEMQVLSGRANVAMNAKVTALDWVEGNDWSLQNLTNGDLVSHPPSELKALPATHFRTSFRLKQKPVRATLYATARGAYLPYINGERVGDHELAPEWTDYFSRIQYQTYDVTSALKEGDNCLAAVVGDGWYAGRLGMSQALHPKHLVRGVYGRATELLAQLEVEYSDGSKQVVATDSNWRCTNDGPIRSSDTLDGEIYDARKEMPNWNRPQFDDSTWRAVSNSERITRLDSQANEPIRISHTLKSVSLTEPKPGVYVFDLGQNLPGVVRLKLRANPGSEILLRHAEMLNDDGTVYTANLRGAPSVDKYIAAGKSDGEVFQPHFTYHGFRYVQVEGLSNRPAIEDLVGVVFHSNPAMVGSFETSDAMLNRLWQNVLWTQRANMMSAPTDCPQRDERLGWMGDIMVFGETATLSMEMAGFYKKWIRDVRDAQADDGRYPDFAPHPYGKNDRFTGVPGWGDAGVTVPWVQYETYGDARMLKEHYESAKKWVEWIYSKNPDFIWRNNRNNDYGDWLNGDTLRVEGFPEKGSECPKDVFATMVFIHSLDIVSKIANVLGDDPGRIRYSEIASRAREKFRIEFVDAEGKIKGDTQAGYALAIGWKLLPDPTAKRAVAHLVEAVKRCDGRMSTGFHSTLYLLTALHENGHQDLAISLLMSKRFPSWGFMIENGATTMWERWDGFVKGRGFQDPGMNSFNHWAFGAVGEFMFNRIAGIARQPNTVGWRNLLLAPEIAHSPLSWAKGSYASPAGNVEVSWKREGSTCTLETTIPPGTTATVILQAVSADEIRENGKTLSSETGIRVVAPDAGSVRLEIPSGSYSFRFPIAK